MPMVAWLVFLQINYKHDVLKVEFTLAALNAKVPFAKKVSACELKIMLA